MFQFGLLNLKADVLDYKLDMTIIHSNTSKKNKIPTILVPQQPYGFVNLFLNNYLTKKKHECDEPFLHYLLQPINKRLQGRIYWPSYLKQNQIIFPHKNIVIYRKKQFLPPSNSGLPRLTQKSTSFSQLSSSMMCRGMNFLKQTINKSVKHINKVCTNIKKAGKEFHWYKNSSKLLPMGKVPRILAVLLR